MSEADNIVNKKKVTISSDSKKKIKNDKNIFVVTTKKENNNTEEDSVFAKTEVISLSDVMKIKKSLNNKFMLDDKDIDPGQERKFEKMKNQECLPSEASGEETEEKIDTEGLDGLDGVEVAQDFLG